MNLTSAAIRSRLEGSSLPRGPADVVMPPGSARWPREMLELVSGQLTPAAVLVPVLEKADGLSLLLTQRSADLKHHAAQVSFPGGQMDDRDENLEATALRETHEEVGILPHNVAVAGYLRTMPTVTGYAVTPVVGLIDGDIELTVDHSEVDYTFDVPLAFLLDRGNDRRVDREMFGQKVPLTEFHWQGERIWGATAQMIMAFRDILLNK